VISGYGWRRVVAHAAISFIALAAAIVPVTLYNIQSGNGRFQLITGVGAKYTASSRSDGTG
jgi:hypothetical protein